MARLLPPFLTEGRRLFLRMCGGLCLFGGLLGADFLAQAAPLTAEDQVMLLPAIAYETPEGKINVELEAWVYERERRPGVTRAFAKYLGIDLKTLSDEERQRFYARTALFRVDSKNSKTFAVRFDGGQVVHMPTTNGRGKSRLRVRLDEKPVSPTKPIAFRVENEAAARGAAENDVWGFAHYAPAQGISVISDIDDTIKISNVRDRKELLKNTFLREYRAVESMRDLYQRFAAEGMAFHYISGSPTQLYPALQEFLSQNGFPPGSVHLKETPLWRAFFSGKDALQTHKIFTIEKILRAYPERQFILIGDSGEYDPEIYALIREKHGKQILSILIRDVRGTPKQAQGLEE